ncbi:hypothetical protein DENIS_4389 [Desulfonema ishimotonii]|uniref:Uncharacterized protein n=1 Tax=Desulfonema ishimotonii TaxID=45657 RepID=A0A401G2P0_9BACT|nr:HD-GYP domain-containing protein [Desulfonema ishimotonii]GBC63395.1 hypothetical protein DENIS_4389 [Desulfonema ishimotonii]
MKRHDRTRVSPQKQLLLGEEFIRAFYRLTQTVKIHRENNRLLIGCAENFVRSFEELDPREDHLFLQQINDRLYFQGEKLLYRQETVSLFDKVQVYFRNRKLRGIRFYQPVRNASFRQILSFARLLNRSEQQQAPGKWLDRTLAKAGLSWAEIVCDEKNKPAGNQQERRERARKIYSRVRSSVEEVAMKLARNGRPGLGKTLRMTQNMVDLMMSDEPLFAALSTIRIYDDYTFCHSVNVAILSMCLGRQLGLSRRSLERLGMCGLLHDLGKVEVPKEILTKPGRLTPEEFEIMKRHSLSSVRLIVRIQASRDRKARLLLPPFEHHLKYDLSGYPRTHRKKPLTLFGRILTIADVYDAITSPRVYRRSVLSPDRALGLMLEGAGRDFDPILLKVFINMLGIYPVGTLLRLDGDELGLVIGADKKTGGRRPGVMLLTPDGNGGYIKGEIIDLNEQIPGTGRYRRHIVESCHPAAYGIQPPDFLL